jgi:hypothetical protein
MWRVMTVTMPSFPMPFTSHWRWRQQGPPKLWYPISPLHEFKIQNSSTWRVTDIIWNKLKFIYHLYIFWLIDLYFIEHARIISSFLICIVQILYLLLRNFSKSPLTSPLIGPNTLPSTMVSDTTSIYVLLLGQETNFHINTKQQVKLQYFKCNLNVFRQDRELNDKMDFPNWICS